MEDAEVGLGAGGGTTGLAGLVGGGAFLFHNLEVVSRFGRDMFGDMLGDMLGDRFGGGE
jgi:hypothetical protein